MNLYICFLSICSCSFGPFPFKEEKISKILWSHDNVYLLHDEELFHGTCQPCDDKTTISANTDSISVHKSKGRGTLTTGNDVSVTSQQSNDLDADDESWQNVKSTSKSRIDNTKRITIKLDQIPYFNRIADIFADVDCRSFIVKQMDSPKYYKPFDIPDEAFKSIYSYVEDYHKNGKAFANILSKEECRQFDKDWPLKCDCFLHIGDESYPVHKMVMVDRAVNMRDLIVSSGLHIPLDSVEGLNGKILQLILRLIYANITPTPKGK